MPETPAPAAPTPPPGKPKRARSPINQALIDELDQAEQLAATTEKAAYVQSMIDEGIDSDFLENLRAKIGVADTLLATATGNTIDKKITTRQEETLKLDLLDKIQAIQKRVKRKYKAADDPMREKYFIGERIGSNRPLLERATRAILATLATDTLPGLKPAEVTALNTALTTYTNVQPTQTSGQSDATTNRALLEAKVKEVADLRRELQYAADTVWPTRNSANAGIRVEFKIPPNKALK